jgi:hypothetical protein
MLKDFCKHSFRHRFWLKTVLLSFFREVDVVDCCLSCGKLALWFINPPREVDVVILKRDFSNVGFSPENDFYVVLLVGS